VTQPPPPPARQRGPLVLRVQRPAPPPELPLEQQAAPQELAVEPRVVRVRAPAVAREPVLPAVVLGPVPAPVVVVVQVLVIAEPAPALRRALAAAPPLAA